MEQIWNDISPIVSSILLEVIKLLALVVLAGFGYLQVKAKASIDTIKNKAQREILHKLANEGFAYAETHFQSESGQIKLNNALSYVSSRLGDLKIQLSLDEVRAAVEKACLEYNAKKKVVIKDKVS
ncbi:phage holin [Paenibacillus lactis]|uniref:phage holin n=1 Tax=Paenibacillus lactis TaxID=228574 RepID=UPI0036BBE0CC